ncbi:MAG: PAS domain-containing protein [Minwuia sp.]|nr:PAS domain-containing protein [Minwuia sp.]
MAGHDADILDIRDQQLRDLYTYWQTMRGDRRIPSRSSFSPAEVPRLLPSLILLDVEPGTGRMVVRVLGTRVATVYGKDYTGRYLDEIYFGANTTSVLDDYGTCARDGVPVLGERNFRNVRDVVYRMERLILPFSDDGKSVNKLIAGLHFIELN